MQWLASDGSVFSAGENDQISAGCHHRSIGERPACRFAAAVRQVISAEVEREGVWVVDLDPVGCDAVFIGESRLVLADKLGDKRRWNHPRRWSQVRFDCQILAICAAAVTTKHSADCHRQ